MPYGYRMDESESLELMKPSISIKSHLLFTFPSGKIEFHSFDIISLKPNPIAAIMN